MAFYTTLNQVIVLFLLMGVGYVLTKSGMISSKTTDQLTTLLCYIVSPAIILYVFLRKFEQDKFNNLLIAAAAAIFIHIFNIIVCTLIFNKKTVKDDNRRIVSQFASIYANAGFMGFPLLQALVQNNGLFYGSAYNGVFQLFNWTHGILLYSGKVEKKSVAKALLNPNLIAVIVGTVMFRFSVSLPGPLYSTVKYISDLNTPLSMIVIGAAITQVPLKELFNDAFVWITVLMRNLVLPLSILFILHSAGLHGELLLCVMIPASCPTAGVTVLLAKLTGRDAAMPAKAMTLSTIMCLITLPFILSVMNWLKF
ncbi:AEC family transporter [[Clostridium] cellulosi]